MDSITEFPIHEPTNVQMVDALGSWFVRVVEFGRKARLADFEAERYAVSFAEGQRKRLGLPSFELV